MEIRNSERGRRRAGEYLGLSNFEFRVSIFVILLAAGCGAPGDPVPPAPLVPVAVSDLSAGQAGDGVELVFSLPPKTVSGERLTAPPAIEIVRASLKPSRPPEPQPPRALHTIRVAPATHNPH